MFISKFKRHQKLKKFVAAKNKMYFQISVFLAMIDEFGSTINQY